MSSQGSQFKQRDARFDGLRVIGLLAIILAHVNPPDFLFQLRNFDVPLMVLVSGAVYGLSSGSSKKYLSYIGGRINRLLLPTWIFLCLFFLFYAAVGKYFSATIILQSFALLDGIGYVWIIRVFLLVAIISPFFVSIYQKVKNKTFYLLFVFATYIAFLFLYNMYNIIPFFHTNEVMSFFFQNYIFYLLSFGSVAGLGLYLLKATKKAVTLLALFFAGTCGYFAYTYFLQAHQLVPTQVYKYPPQAYYLSYALAVSLALYVLSDSNLFQNIFSHPLLQFISASSLWIYLWQIFFLYQWDSLSKYLPSTFKNFLWEYFFVVTLSVGITYIQKLLIKNVAGKLHENWLRSFLTVSFLK